MVTVGFTGCPGRSNAVPADVAGCPGWISVVAVGLPGRNAFSGAVAPDPTGAETCEPGSRAGAVFAVAPGVSLAILACNAAACLGSVKPFHPLSNFGVAIAEATGGSEPGFLERVTVGAAMASTPGRTCDGLPFPVTGRVPAFRVTLTEGIGWLPVRTSALLTAW